MNNNILGFAIICLVIFILIAPPFFIWKITKKPAKFESFVLLLFATGINLIILPVISLVINGFVYLFDGSDAGSAKYVIAGTAYFLLPLIFFFLGMLTRLRLISTKSEIWRLLSLSFFVGTMLILPIGWLVEIFLN